ncbi:aldo/keto reductase [Paenibacillus sp. SYP-B3998]|uniref:Aldo/keto reductase n=1 Tax=Paenibacillus sp. SYP-B3998 TaxID=2678564 RepID=A0A6G3ZX34_9BACL|nr:aldo/keto reductase [Paenibacillus sp. SYP-B3998]NEW06675.1 aldo/keto reductase [Paenibacillus sp. SYP-B3998]
MEKRQLGQSGLEASVLGFGSWAIGGDAWGPVQDQESIEAIQAALDGGINLFDTAPVYGKGHSEALLAKALGSRRKEVLIATKCGLVWDEAGTVSRNSTYDSIMREVDLSLKRLQTDYIDVYQIHWPDLETDMEQSAKAMNDLYQAGKIRAIGVSNFDVSHMEAFRKISPLHTLQPPYHLLRRDIEETILPYCVDSQVGVLAYGPLGHGLFSGKMTPGTTFPEGDFRAKNALFQGDAFLRNLQFVQELKAIAAEKDTTPGHLAIAWVLAQPGLSVALVGAKTAEQVRGNLRAADVKLTSADHKRIEAALQVVYTA